MFDFPPDIELSYRGALEFVIIAVGAFWLLSIAYALILMAIQSFKEKQ